MKKLLFIILLFIPLLGTAAKKSDVNTFTYGNGHFQLNGEDFIIKAAELHYARIPREYWDHRVKMCKALGMNTICVYVFWNFHEPEEGVWDFSGNHDLAAFMEVCKKNGMWAIVRPGPYACAEWEMGGLPWWLLKNRDVELRTLDSKFFEPAVRFERKIAEVLAPYRLENGGNIIMLQVENEYGSYDKNKPYMSAMRDALREAGWDKTQLFQCDWSSNFTDNALDDLLWTMNFGTGAKVLKEFQKVKEMRPDAPMMCSEFWSGWFDGWGRAHETRPSKDMVQGISTMLDNDISFSLYMTHGGSSFAWWAGSNNNKFSPDCTSYDYDAPIDEQGAATPKYYELRELLQKHSAKKLPSVPKALPVMTVPEIQLAEVANLFNTCSDVIETHDIQPVEQFNMGYGSVLYTTTLPAIKAGGYISINEMNDYGIVYINGRQIGQLYRGKNFENTLQIREDVEEGSQLAIYIYTYGRVNYSKMIHDPKGITDNVMVYTMAGQHEATYNLKDWQVRLFPLAEGLRPADIKSDRSMPVGPATQQPKYYAASFNLKKTADTYLDMSGWGMGLVWVNGHCIGRFWNVGPQQTLFMPGCWLKKGENEIVVLDVTGPSSTSIRGLDKPVIDQLHREFLPADAVQFTGNVSAETGKNRDSVANDAAPGAKK